MTEIDTPETSPESAVPASQHSADWKVGVEYVSFYSRCGAMLIDTIAMLLPFSFFFSMAMQLYWGDANFGQEEAMIVRQAYDDPMIADQVASQLAAGGFLARWMMENIIFTIISGGLYLMFWYFYSATPGKIIMGMKIIDAQTGEPPSMGQNILRYIGYFVSSLPLGLGFFWVLWDKHSQGWHDKMANTVVVYKKTLPRELARASLSKET